MASDDQPYRNPFTNRVRTGKPLFTSRRQYQPTPLPTQPSTDNYSENGSVGSDSAGSTNGRAFDDHPDPPLNIPKQWGRKAKKYDGWMQKILQPDQPIDAVENNSASIQNLTPPESSSGSPRSNQPWNADLDFTAQSLHTSPQLRVRQYSADEERVLRRASKLEELRRREAELPPEDELTILEEEGEKIPNTPITIFTAKAFKQLYPETNAKLDSPKDDAYDALRLLSRSLSKSASPSPEPEKEAVVPEFTARVERATPEPTKENIPIRDTARTRSESLESKPKIEDRRSPAMHTSTESESRSRGREGRSTTRARLESGESLEASRERRRALRAEREERNAKGRSESADNHVLVSKADSIASKSYTKEEDPEDRITAEARLFDLQDNKSSRSPSPVIQTVLKTPRVTGAFIDTPTPGPRKRDITPERIESIRAASPDATPKARELSKPPRRPLINTARPTSAAEDVKRIQAKLDAGEDTTLDDFANFVDEPISKRELDSDLDEKEALERLNGKMQRTTTSIRDARHGIERLEEQVNTATRRKTIYEEALEARIAEMERRLMTAGSEAFIVIKAPIPKLWTRNPGTWRNWKFTWLGLILFIFLAWFTTETAVCSHFCHPQYATVNDWRIDDPFFPWAIPTKLDQWTGKVVSGLWKGGMGGDVKGHAREAGHGGRREYGGRTHDEYFYNDEMM